MKKKIKHRLTGRKRKPDRTGADTPGETTDSVVEQGGVYSIYYRVLYSLPEGGLCVCAYGGRRRERSVIFIVRIVTCIYTILIE